ncbi:hypothetical protein AAHE18_02G065100 [Arachis hypogaea]
MASKKKQSEGIALLSMYNDDGDDDMEDAEEDEEDNQEIDMRHEQNEDAAAGGFAAENGRFGSNDGVADEVSTPAEERRFGTSTPQCVNTNMVISPPQDQRGVARGKLTIVDYGHDEVAMSPEPEEGQIGGSVRVMYGDQLNLTNGDLLDRTPSGAVHVMTPSNQANTPQLSEQLKSDTMNDDAMIGPDDAEPVEAGQDEQKAEDPLNKFLPPPPKAKCSEELQRKINKFFEYKEAGKIFNAEVRNRKNYRNPDFLLHAVRYQEIDQIGSCFSKDVFDPHGYDSSDFFDEIVCLKYLMMLKSFFNCQNVFCLHYKYIRGYLLGCNAALPFIRESERKEHEKKKAQKMEFIAGGTQPGIVAAGAPRISLPVAGGSAVAASGLVPPIADSINRDGRQNKKSKWDKVDGDRKNPLPSVGQDSVSTVGTHAAILSTVNAGSGYMLFVGDRRWD